MQAHLFCNSEQKNLPGGWKYIMRNVFAFLFLALTLFSPTRAEDVVYQAINSKIATGSSTCPLIPQKPKRPITIINHPKIQTPTQPNTIVQICAPILSTQAKPPLTPSPPPHPSPPIFKDPPQKASNPECPKQDSADIFKFKIKNLLEAEIRSGSRWLVWSVVFIFAIFSALIIFFSRSTTAKSIRPWVIWFICLSVVGLLAFFWAQGFSSSANSQAAIDQLYEKYTNSHDKVTGTSASHLDLQLEQLRQTLLELGVDLKSQHDVTSKVERHPLLLSLLLQFIFALGVFSTLITALLVFKIKRLRLVSQTADSKKFDSSTWSNFEVLPLEAINRLENEISMLKLETNTPKSFYEVDIKPNIPDPTDFLRALNIVCHQLERPESKDFSNITKCKFKKNFNSYDLGWIHNELEKLDELLSSRHGANTQEWRLNALAALARTRRAFIAVCENVQGLYI